MGTDPGFTDPYGGHGGVTLSPEGAQEAGMEQCQFIREIGGVRFRCLARARYGDFCGRHKRKELKGQPKGCRATARSGAPCRAVISRDDLCAIHWQKAFGHVFIRDGQAFRCSLCGWEFSYLAVEGRGKVLKGSITRLAKCPVKLATPS